MTFPNNLTDSYTALRASALVCQGDTSQAALVEFARHLNSAQPRLAPKEIADLADAIERDRAAYDLSAYQTVQSLYRANRRGYIQCIRSTTNEATVLWTDARAIVSWFELNRLVYIKQKDGRFWVHALQQDTAPVLLRAIRVERVPAAEVRKFYAEREQRTGQRAPRLDRNGNVSIQHYDRRVKRAKAEDLELSFPEIQDGEVVLKQ
jgi:hypothetical protein